MYVDTDCCRPDRNSSLCAPSRPPAPLSSPHPPIVSCAHDVSLSLVFRALDEAADADLGQGEDGREGGANGTGAGFGGVEGAMVGINSVHVALSSVSAIQVSTAVLSYGGG